MADINDIWNTFKQHLFKCLDKHIPFKIIKSNNRLPWFNHKIKRNAQEKTEPIQPSKKN